MAWDVAVAGTVHLDEITTPAGHRTDQLGGSAVYFALAAARQASVHLNGIVGRDSAAGFVALLDRAGVRHEGLVVSDEPTFRWHARHDFERWVAVDTTSEEGCDPLWGARLSDAAGAAQVLFLASMRPALQGDALRQSRARLVGADSMTEYTGPQRDAVRELAHACDVLFLNQSELASLTGAPITTWRQEAIAMCGVGRLRAVVVKGGPRGASLVTDDGIVTRPAARVETVVDPTGAGDALAGGFLGACAAAERDDVEYFATALDEGLRCAAAAIAEFGLAGLMPSA
ncbi:MAG TPA: PfkB family carbohydrate kinase [Candidatus Deferrimicrobium sp.]|nr:PfkB family carbohydrate kinase [Candidatus Deferrimicrobium sp.]